MSNFNYYGFETLGSHTKDFGLKCIERKIGFPKKNKITVQPAFSNQVLDFSNVYGGQIYDEREYTFTFLVEQAMPREETYRLWTRVVNWLSSANTKVKLYDDLMHDYYYLAELVEAPDFDESVDEDGNLSFTFTCYPFRIYEEQEGNDIWDIFDFELDIAQITKYTINGKQNITLYNVGISSISPILKASSSMTITMGAITYTLPAGTTESHKYRLMPGVNKMTVSGNGTLEFIWHKELI